MSALVLLAAGRSSLASSGSAAMLAMARGAFSSPALHQASCSWATFSPHATFRTSSLVAAADPKQQKIVMPTAGVPAGTNQTFASGHVAPHPGYRPEQLPTAGSEGQDDAQLKEGFMEHPHYDWKYLESVGPVHVPPKDAADRVGMTAVRIMRSSFDWITGYGHNNMTERKWLVRFIFLETVAGVPGMVAGMLRHLHSLRLMRRDKGWIHQLLEEAENERMHLLTFLELGKPGLLFRAAVLATQGIFFNGYFLAYLLWPKACHSFVGYLEEEAVKTYTQALAEMEPGRSLAHWRDAPCPPIAQTYWGLPKEARMRELILAIRADEACHSHVNHTLKTLKPSDANPFAMSGKSQLP